MNKFVKAFEFYDFFEEKWDDWKTSVLEQEEEASFATEGDEDDVEGAALAYGTGEVTKLPILHDEDDIKFLWQIKPEDWAAALQYRYDTAMDDVIKHREKHGAFPDHNWVEELVLRDASGRPRITYKSPGGKGFYLGATTLAEKLGKPRKLHAKHDRAGTGPGPGIIDVDPGQEDESHPQHHSNYKYGYNDIDLSPDGTYDPMKITTARSIITNAIKTAGVGLGGKAPRKVQDPYTGETLDVNYLYPKDLKDIHGKFPRYVGNVKAQSQEEDTAHAHHQIDHTNEDGTKETIQSRPVPLMVPAVKRNIYFKKYNRKGKVVEDASKGVATAMPVISTGKTIPRVPITAEQRWVIAKRRHTDKAQTDPEVIFRKQFIGANTPEEKMSVWKDILYSGYLGLETGLGKLEKKEMKQTMGAVKDKANYVSRPRTFQGLLSNWDLWSSEQKAVMKDPKNHKKLVHLLRLQQAQEPKYLQGEEREKAKKYEDHWADPQHHFISFGHDPQRGMTKVDYIPAETANEIFNKYENEVTFNAYEGLYDYTKSVAGKSKEFEKALEDQYPEGRVKRQPLKTLPDPIIKMVEKISPKLIGMAKYLIALQLNSLKYGIYDPELGLTGPEEKSTIERNRKWRADLAYRLADDFSQIAHDDIDSRRKRYQGTLAGFATGLPTGGEEGGRAFELGTKGRENLMQKRKEAEEEERERGGVEERGRGKRTVYSQPTGPEGEVMGRVGWHVPFHFGNKMEDFFLSRKEQFSRFFGYKAAQEIDKLKKEAEGEADKVTELYEKAAAQLSAQGVTNREELKKQADKFVNKNIEAEKTRKEEDPGFQKHYQIMSDLVQGLIDNQEIENLIAYNPVEEKYVKTGKQMYIDDPKLSTAAGVVDLLRTFFTFEKEGKREVIKKGVEELALPLYMAANQENVRQKKAEPISQAQAIADIKRAGVTPKGIMPAPAAAPTPAAPTPLPAAAKTLERPIEDLLTNVPANIKELVARKAELLQDPARLRSIMNALNTKIQAKQERGIMPSKEEVHALMKLDSIQRRG